MSVRTLVLVVGAGSVGAAPVSRPPCIAMTSAGVKCNKLDLLMKCFELKTCLLLVLAHLYSIACQHRQ